MMWGQAGAVAMASGAELLACHCSPMVPAVTVIGRCDGFLFHKQKSSPPMHPRPIGRVTPSRLCFLGDSFPSSSCNLGKKLAATQLIRRLAENMLPNFCQGIRGSDESERN